MVGEFKEDTGEVLRKTAEERWTPLISVQTFSDKGYHRTRLSIKILNNNDSCFGCCDARQCTAYSCLLTSPKTINCVAHDKNQKIFRHFFFQIQRLSHNTYYLIIDLTSICFCQQYNTEPSGTVDFVKLPFFMNGVCLYVNGALLSTELHQHPVSKMVSRTGNYALAMCNIASV